MAQKLRTRGHRVVLNRSAGGDFGITFMLVILGAFMFLPMYYVVIQSLKPLDELFMFPPKFWVMKPIAPFVGMVVFMIRKADGVKYDVVVYVILVYMGRQYKFILAA